jgi:hypothetical protein
VQLAVVLSFVEWKPSSEFGILWMTRMIILVEFGTIAAYFGCGRQKTVLTNLRKPDHV